EVRHAHTGEPLGRIDRGLLLLVGIGQGDTEADAAWLVDKVAGLRVFTPDRPPDAPGNSGKDSMDRSVREVGGGLLIISQFTLCGDCRKGRRPSFTDALAPVPAEQLYEHFLALARATGLPVASGRFGAMMHVELV